MAPWTVGIWGAIAIIALGLFENETFLLLTIFLLPMNMIANAGPLAHDFGVAVRMLVQSVSF